jgi:AraC-like DNA-binding protein
LQVNYRLLLVTDAVFCGILLGGNSRAVQRPNGGLELVRQYLGDASVELTEAAFLVGYEDPNSFYRAFRSWKGRTPAEWRAANQQTAV